MDKQRGVTLVEMLMVLVGIAVILSLSIHRYRDYQRHIQLAGVKNDIASIQEAANRYYHITGCHSDGSFAGDSSPSMKDLGLQLDGRPPIVPFGGNSYSAKIVETNEPTTNNKPVYALQVRATLNTAYSDKRMSWYQKRFSAENVEGHTLLWTTLPSNTASEPGTKLWVMKAEGEQFRKAENEKMNNEKMKNKTPSTSYCAH